MYTVREKGRVELFVGGKRVFMATVGEGFGYCTPEVADKELQAAIKQWEGRE